MAISLSYRFKILLNLLSKLLYLSAGVFAFVATDYLLNGDFRTYGNEWVKWNRLNNTIALDYMGARDHPKPGKMPFKYCVNTSLRLPSNCIMKQTTK